MIEVHRLQRGFVLVALAVVVAAGLTLMGCGGDDDENEAQIRVMLTDMPMSRVKEVHVHIVRIEMVGSGGPVVLVNDAAIPDDIELIALAGNPMLLGRPWVPVDTYTQVRLILSEEAGENWVVDENDVVHHLTIPSGAQTGVKLVSGQFTIVAGQISTLLLDFNAAASVHEAGASGNWIMRPTVAASVVNVTDLHFGSISGTILDENGHPLVVPDDRVLGIFIQTPFGAIAVAEVDATDGSFEIPALLVGAYDLKLCFADTDWNPIGDPLTFRIDGGDPITVLPITLADGDTLVYTIVVPMP